VSRLAAVVLAAGRSSRMGELKPLLPLGDTSVLARAVAVFREIGVDDVVVVVGWRADEVAAAAHELGVPTALNPGWRRGMFSSVATGVAALDAGVERFFLLPVDCALVRPETAGRLARAALARETIGREPAAAPAPVIYPVHGGCRGHPPLIACAALPAELGDEPEGGLRGLLAAFDAAALDVATGDPGTLVDLDRPADYRRACDEVAFEALPDERRCLELLRDAGLPAAVVAHSRAVATVAVAFARRLNEHGLCLHEGLLRAAGLLHDIARLQEDHAAAGAARLRELGYRRLAPPVARHIDLHLQVEGENTRGEAPPPPLETGRPAGEGMVARGLLPGETELLYLADKLVRGAQVVDLTERFAAKLRELEGQPEGQAAARARLWPALDVAATVERLTGAPAAAIARNALKAADVR
jgi:CTP:molybdopterin cytidylyltransferase MocA